MAGKKWVQKAFSKNKGALRAKAKKQGLVKGNNKLSASALNKLSKEGGTTAKEANLAKTARGFKHGGKRK